MTSDERREPTVDDFVRATAEQCGIDPNVALAERDLILASDLLSEIAELHWSDKPNSEACAYCGEKWSRKHQRDMQAKAVIALVREQVAAAIEEHPGPDPSPAKPAWWDGYLEAQRDAAKIARGPL